jgi:hypothetical protein
MVATYLHRYAIYGYFIVRHVKLVISKVINKYISLKKERIKMTTEQNKNTGKTNTEVTEGKVMQKDNEVLSATNQFDVERQRLIVEHEKAKEASWEQVQKMKLQTEERMNRFNKVTNIVEKAVVGGLISLVCIKSFEYSAEVQKHKSQFGE